MNGRAVLVTGGAGYIGSHTCKALAQAGYLPVALDNLVCGHRDAVRWGPLVEADARDRDAVQRAITRHRINAVVHFAGYAYVGESMRDPARYFDNNVVASLDLFSAARAGGVSRFVFSSSCATYGVPANASIHETDVQQPVNPYGESKLFVERVLHWFELAYGISSVALRYFNAAGADRDGELGERHDPETHLIPLAIGAALGTHPPLQVFGTDYATSDGTAVRDYVHVTDLANAHVLALSYLERAGPSAAFNLGTGRGHSVRDVIAAVERVAGRTVAWQPGARRAGDPPALVAAPGLAQEKLGWTTPNSDLDTIVTTAWRWHTR